MLIALIGLCVWGVLVITARPLPPPPHCYHKMDVRTLTCLYCGVYAPYGYEENGNILTEEWPTEEFFD